MAGMGDVQVAGMPKAKKKMAKMPVPKKAKMQPMAMPNYKKATVKTPMIPKGKPSKKTASGVQGGLSSM